MSRNNSNNGVNVLIAETNTETLKNINAVLVMMAGTLEQDSDQLGLLLAVQSMHNAMSTVLKSDK